MLPDGHTLVGMMQAPLDNPLSAGRTSRTLRLLFLETRTDVTRQYLYQLEPNPSAGQTSTNGVSELVALSDTTFLVLGSRLSIQDWQRSTERAAASTAPHIRP